MELRNLSVVLLALLLAGMTMVPCVNAEAQPSGIMNVTTTQLSNEVTPTITLQELPVFQPGINDKLSYEEEKLLQKNYTQSSSVPETDMVEIIFSQAWVLQNDRDSRKEMIQLTFPVSWLNTPEVQNDESVIMLRVPKHMLELDNISKDPTQICISYPEYMFEEFLNLDQKNIKLQERQDALDTAIKHSVKSTFSAPKKDSRATTGSKSIDRQVRAWYQRDTAYTVTKVIGYIDPTSYSNSGESFRNYNEREIYLDRSGDTIEFISDFTDTGEEYVWVAIYDEGTWSTAWNWLNIDVTGTLQPINYRFYINSGVYNLFLQDTSSGLWYSQSYTDTDNPSTRVNWLVGSTEVDTEGGISNYFRTETNPIRDDSTYTGNSWETPQTTFDFNSYTSDEQYVYITAGFDGSGRLASQHIAGQNY